MILDYINKNTFKCKLNILLIFPTYCVRIDTFSFCAVPDKTCLFVNILETDFKEVKYAPSSKQIWYTICGIFTKCGICFQNIIILPHL